jgi:hypothetical protein
MRGLIALAEIRRRAAVVGDVDAAPDDVAAGRQMWGGYGEEVAWASTPGRRIRSRRMDSAGGLATRFMLSPTG